MGCDAHYNGRYTEAEEDFKWIIEENKDKDYEGAKKLLNKARLRLGVLSVDQYKFKEALELFRDLKTEGSDWRERTYAAHWIQRLSRYSSHELAMLNCGTKAIAYLLEKEGKKEEARKIIELLPDTSRGHSLKDLSEIAAKYGYSMTALRVSLNELKELPLPAVVHMGSQEPGKGGHYWILDKINKDSLELYDPQSARRFGQSFKAFAKEWSSHALVFSNKENLPGVRLSEGDMKRFYGGCCGTPAPEDGTGNPDRNGAPDGMGNPNGDNTPDGNGKPVGCGSPAWSVNIINMNLYVHDIPLWYKSTLGPSVEISLSYNSQSAIAYNEPFGNKWQFNYGSYLVVDTAGNVTVFMPDGRRDEYTIKTGGYNHPYQVFNTLTKIAENHYELKFHDDTIYVYNIPAGTASLQPFLVEIRDRQGQKLTVTYDSNVRLTTINDALGRATTLTYNAQGLVTQVTDPFSRSAAFEYDADRNLTKITDMGGYWSTISYDADAYITSIENQKGKWLFYIEPADGVVAYSDDYAPPGEHMWQSYRITMTNPFGDKEEYFYHGGCGNAVGINDCGYSWYVSPKHYVPYASGSVNNFRSARKTIFHNTLISGNGEISKIEDPEGTSISFGYDYSNGNRTSITDANGNITSITYDTRGNITNITDPLSNSVQLNYDSNDNLTSLIDPAGNSYIYTYDANNNLIKVKDPKNGEANLAYFSYGKLQNFTDAKGQSTSFTYDNLWNLIRYISPGGTDSYTYDNIGRVESHTDPKGNTIHYSYDNLNRSTNITYPDGFIKRYTYDCCGLGSVSDRNGTVTFSHDVLNRLSDVTDVYGNLISYGYDKNGNLATLTYPDSKQVVYAYDDADRLTTVTDWLSNVTSYVYDSTGALVSTILPDNSITMYEYDKARRLTSLLDFTSDASVNAVFKYTLDKLDNRTAVNFYQPLNMVSPLQDSTYSYNSDNRLLTAGSTVFNYDNNGNLITKTLGSNVTNYSWDFNNMLTQVTVGGDTYGYKYDGLGNRIAKIVNGAETKYVVDPKGRLSRVLAEATSTGSVTAYYVYGRGLISKITHTNQAYHYHYDGIGSTIAITDSLGTVVNKYAYDAFGKVISQTETIPNPFKYVGRYGVMDDGNGLLYMRARYYDAEIGRFINKDPIGLLSGVNMYTYTNNCPVNYVDPLGLQSPVQRGGAALTGGIRGGIGIGIGVGIVLLLIPGTEALGAAILVPSVIAAGGMGLFSAACDLLRAAADGNINGIIGATGEGLIPIISPLP
jgi:RHS repeat-associated protein